MKETATKTHEVAGVVAAYLAASEAASVSTQRLNEAWKSHFESGDEEPSRDWVAQVAGLQRASDLALERARMATSIRVPASTDLPPRPENEPVAVVRVRRRRRRENKLLTTIGKPGQKLLRAVLITLLVVSTLVATGAGISLSLEVAGFLHLIDDPVQLPVLIQLAIFVVAAGLAFGLRWMLKPVDRALYGSKGVRPKGFTL